MVSPCKPANNCQSRPHRQDDPVAFSCSFIQWLKPHIPSQDSFCSALEIRCELEGRSNQKPEHLENQFTCWCAELTEAAELGKVNIVKFFSWEELTWKSADYCWYLLSPSVYSTMTLYFCIYRCTWQSNGREIQLNSVENADNIWTLVPSREVLLSVTLQNRNLNWFL